MRKLNPTALALLGVALLLLILWLFASSRSSDEDKLIGNVATEQAPQSAADNRCASKATYELIKREPALAPGGTNAPPLMGELESQYTELKIEWLKLVLDDVELVADPAPGQ